MTGARRGWGPASLAVAAAIASACSASRSQVRAPAQPEVLVFDPVVITVDGRDLAQLNDEELFALGSSAYAAGEYEKAARCFSRLADVYQSSGHRAAALYNAGLAYERLDRFQEALERFRPLADPDRGQGDSLGASFRAAECLYHLSRFDEAAAILAVIAARADVKPQERLEAKVHRGICLVEGGELEAGESALREALGYWTDKKESERLDDYFPAQAQYYLGEVYRLHFEGVGLDAYAGDEKLRKDLEYKCDLLLSAQGHYLRAIRVGDGEWATASGFRIGALYEQLYDALIAVKVPAGFDEEQAQVYREELRKRIRVLVSKAMDIYERTLEAAERVGALNAYVQRARQSLERMKQILLEGGPGESAGGEDGKAAPLAGSPSEPPS